MTNPRDPRFDLAVETRDLTKAFAGNPPGFMPGLVEAVVDAVQRRIRHPPQRTVVDRVSLSIRRGEIFGVLGSNGAGKTTLLKLLSCLLYPDGGSGTVNGYDLIRQRLAVRRSVVIAKTQASNGVGFLWQLDAWENLMFRARLHGIPRSEAEQRADYVIERLDIRHKARDHTWDMSVGERQRLSLAMTFLARMPLVILDEPTSHLDPQSARLVRRFIREDLNQKNGQTVIMSTHYLEEADQLCDRVAIMEHGRILACDRPAELKRVHVPDPILEVRAIHYAPKIGQRVKDRCGIAELLERFEDVAVGQVRLRPKWPQPEPDVDGFLQELRAEGVEIRSVRQIGATLDDLYYQLVQKQVT